MRFHLAQANIARMRGHPHDAVMSGLVARIDEMNRLAEQSPGFIWRLKGSEATPEALQVFDDCFVPFDASQLFYNMSVWESVEALKNYAFKTQHAEMLRDTAQWIDHFDRAHLALWWIPQGHVPTIAESAERLRSVHERGATEFAFTFHNLFPAPLRDPEP
jgi:hypothetical protein